LIADTGAVVPQTPRLRRPVQPIQFDSAGYRRLRFVFSDGVISLTLATDATFEDIARNLDDLAARHCGKPAAIDVTLAVPPGELVRRASSRTEQSHG
jgi:hypothetical protein